MLHKFNTLLPVRMIKHLYVNVETKYKRDISLVTMKLVAMLQRDENCILIRVVSRSNTQPVQAILSVQQSIVNCPSCDDYAYHYQHAL